MSQQHDIEKDTRIVIWFKEDDFGVLCPQIGLENKHLVHSDGRTAAIVPKDDCVVAFSLPRREEKPAAAAEGEDGQQQSAARAQHARDIDTGTDRCAPKATGPSRKCAAKAAGDSSGTGDNGSSSSSSSKSQQRRAQLRECKRLRAAHDCIGYALRLEARGSGRRRNSGGATAAAAAENGAGGQGAQQQQQQRRQQQDHQQQQPPLGETEATADADADADAATIEADVAAATAAETEALAEWTAAKAQVDAAYAAFTALLDVKRCTDEVWYAAEAECVASMEKLDDAWDQKEEASSRCKAVKAGAAVAG
jgi:hypothetical protein